MLCLSLRDAMLSGHSASGSDDVRLCVSREATAARVTSIYEIHVSDRQHGDKAGGP